MLLGSINSRHSFTFFYRSRDHKGVESLSQTQIFSSLYLCNGVHPNYFKFRLFNLTEFISLMSVMPR